MATRVTLLGGLGPDSGSESPDEAADSYAAGLLGDSGYHLEKDESGDPNPTYRAVADDGRLLIWFETFDTGFGRFVAVEHSYCVANVEQFSSS